MKMNSIRVFLLFVVQLCAVSLPAQQRNDSVFSWTRISSFPFIRMSGDKVINSKISLSSKPLQLFIFLSPECPISKNYTSTLNKLFEEYQNDVEFFGCISGKGFTRQEIGSFITTYKIAYPMLVDESLKFTKYTGATVTPEVILLNHKGQTIYKGAIDDWVLGLGKQRLTVSNHYLRDAISASINNKEVLVKRTTPYGCLINDY